MEGAGATGAVEGGDGGDEEGDGAGGGGAGEGEGGGGAWGEGAEEGGVDPREAGGEEARRDGGAVERAVAPPARRAEAAGVVLVEVRQEVGLAAAAELVHGHQPFVHGSPMPCQPPVAAALWGFGWGACAAMGAKMKSSPLVVASTESRLAKGHGNMAFVWTLDRFILTN